MSKISAESVVKNLAFDVLLKRALGELLGSFPFLSLPIIKQVTVFMVTRTAELLYEQIEDHMEFKAIDVDEDLKVKAHIAAVSRLESAKTEEDLKNAKEEYRKTFANLIHFKSS